MAHNYPRNGRTGASARAASGRTPGVDEAVPARRGHSNNLAADFDSVATPFGRGRGDERGAALPGRSSAALSRAPAPSASVSRRPRDTGDGSGANGSGGSSAAAQAGRRAAAVNLDSQWGSSIDIRFPPCNGTHQGGITASSGASSDCLSGRAIAGRRHDSNVRGWVEGRHQEEGDSGGAVGADGHPKVMRGGSLRSIEDSVRRMEQELSIMRRGAGHGSDSGAVAGLLSSRDLQPPPSAADLSRRLQVSAVPSPGRQQRGHGAAGGGAANNDPSMPYSVASLTGRAGRDSKPLQPQGGRASSRTCRERNTANSDDGAGQEAGGSFSTRDRGAQGSSSRGLHQDLNELLAQARLDHPPRRPRVSVLQPQANEAQLAVARGRGHPGMSEQQQLAEASSAVGDEAPNNHGPGVGLGLGLSREEEELARAVEASTLEYRSRSQARPPPSAGRRPTFGLQGSVSSGLGPGNGAEVESDADLARALEESALAAATQIHPHIPGGEINSSPDVDLARAIQESLQVASRPGGPRVGGSFDDFMAELDAREREMNFEDATAGGLMAAIHGLQGHMSEDDALEAALKASRFQMEQHAVLSQADRAMQAARLKEELVSTGRTSARGQGRAIDNSRVSKEKEDWRATGSSGADLCTRRTRKMSGEDIVNGVSAGRRAALGPPLPRRSRATASGDLGGAGGMSAAGLAAVQQSILRTDWLAESGSHRSPTRRRSGQPGIGRGEGAAAGASRSRSAGSIEAGLVRSEQDAEYEESLAQDRVKEEALRKAREEAAKAAEARLRREADAKAAAEAEALKEAERAASARADLEKLAKDLQARLPEEPRADDPSCSELAIDAAPVDKRLTRRFPQDCAASVVYDYARAVMILEGLAAGGPPSLQTLALARPSGFKLVQNFAPAPLPDDATTLKGFGVGRRDKFIVRAS